MIVDPDSLYPGTNALKQLCGECEEVIESVEDGWDDFLGEQLICTACMKYEIDERGTHPANFTLMKDVIE